jgi:hypothetical protein
VYLTLLFFPATQTCCLEDEDGVEFFNEEFYVCVVLVAYSCGLCSLPLFCFRERVILSFEIHYLCNNYILFMTFGVTVNTFVRMCGIKCFWAHMR